MACEEQRRREKVTRLAGEFENIDFAIVPRKSCISESSRGYWRPIELSDDRCEPSNETFMKQTRLNCQRGTTTLETASIEIKELWATRNVALSYLAAFFPRGAS